MKKAVAKRSTKVASKRISKKGTKKVAKRATKKIVAAPAAPAQPTGSAQATP